MLVQSSNNFFFNKLSLNGGSKVKLNGLEWRRSSLIRCPMSLSSVQEGCFWCSVSVVDVSLDPFIARHHWPATARNSFGFSDRGNLKCFTLPLKSTCNPAALQGYDKPEWLWGWAWISTSLHTSWFCHSSSACISSVYDSVLFSHKYFSLLANFPEQVAFYLLQFAEICCSGSLIPFMISLTPLLLDQWRARSKYIVILMTLYVSMSLTCIGPYRLFAILSAGGKRL